MAFTIEVVYRDVNTKLRFTKWRTSSHRDRPLRWRGGSAACTFTAYGRRAKSTACTFTATAGWGKVVSTTAVSGAETAGVGVGDTGEVYGRSDARRTCAAEATTLQESSSEVG